MKVLGSMLCYEIAAAELFDDPEFVAWLNRRVGKGLATWHCGGEPDEYSDVFVWYDEGEGDESPWSAGEETGMPEGFWEALDNLCYEHGISFGILRLLNQEE